MNKLVAALAAVVLAAASSAAIAADAQPKPAPAATAAKPLEKPANVTPEAWAKMTDAEKKKAVEDAAKAKSTAATKEAPKAKEKKGGC